jgi:dGTPase
MLAPFACQPDASRGRLFEERMSSFRSPYQRDRDRIIHSKSFRRLKHKTQVFLSPFGALGGTFDYLHPGHKLFLTSVLLQT